MKNALVITLCVCVGVLMAQAIWSVALVWVLPEIL